MQSNFPIDLKAPAPREITLTVRAALTYESGKGGTLHLRLADNIGKIMDGDRQIGAVSSLIGGGVEIECDGHHYTIGALDIWHAFNAAAAWEAGAGVPPDALRSVQPRYDPSIEREYLESQEYANLLRAEAAERALASWRGWAQFVYLGGGEVPSLRTDAEMQADVCGTHDRDVKAVLARAEAADQQREMLSGTVRQDAAVIADLMGQLEAAERARDALDLRLRAASEFIRDVIEAIGRPQPPPEAVVDLPEMLMQVVGQIEEGKEAMRARDEALALNVTIESMQTERSLAVAAVEKERNQERRRAMAAEATLATLGTLVDEFETDFANALDTVSETVIFAQCVVPKFVKAVTAALTGDPAGTRPLPEVAASASQGEDARSVPEHGESRGVITSLRPLPDAAAPMPMWTGATPPADFKVSMTVPPAPATLPVYQCEEWQCRYVFPDQMCCIRPLGHEGDHAPAILAARGAVPSPAPATLPPCPNCVSEHGHAKADCPDCGGSGICPSAARGAVPEARPPDVRAIVETLGFDPTNHHNALACPYCNPDRLPLAEARAAAQAPQDGVALIAAERQRQISLEGWTSAHDDGHDKGEMVVAAVRYAVHDLPKRRQPMLRAAAARAWRWASCHWNPKDPIRNLVRAGALIAAEIDRRLRQGEAASAPAPHPPKREKRL